MRKVYFWAAALAVTFAGCDNSEMDTAIDNGLVPVEVSAGINGLKTRVTDDSQWEKKDVIGIYGSSGKLEYSTKKYVSADGDGNFEPATSYDAIYFGADDGKFSAFYPYVEYGKLTNYKTIEGNVITQQVTNQTPSGGQKRIDFLYATKEGTKENPKLDFQFDHKMSKLVIRLKKGTGFSSSSYITFKSWYDLTFSSSNEDLHSKVTFNPKDGTITPTNPVKELAFLYQAALRVSGEDVEDEHGVVQYTEFVYIICPGETVTGGLKFDLYYVSDNITYTTQLYTDQSKTKFETQAGTQYIYTVTVNKTEAKVTETSINSWTSAELPDDGKVEANS